MARTVYSALTGDFGGLRMPEIYSDGMVLQRGRPLEIMGTADAGEKVTVRLAGQKNRLLRHLMATGASALIHWLRPKD